MITIRTAPILLAVFCSVLALLAPAGAQDQPVTPAIDDPKGHFERMARFLAGAQNFQTTVRMGYDVLQDSGQKIEFGERHRVTIARPDRLRAEILKSSGEEGLVLFDGRRITAHNTTHGVYAQTDKPGRLEAVLDYFLNDLGMRLPLALMFRSDFPEEMAQRLKALDLVEVSEVTDVPCVHLAGRTDEIDFQVWIPETGDPLPQRLTITYRDEEGQPQFWADFEHWDMAPAISAEAFAFTPPQGAERIPFLVEIERALGEETPKGGD